MRNIALPKPPHEDSLTTGRRVDRPPFGIRRRGLQQCVWINVRFVGQNWHYWASMSNRLDNSNCSPSVMLGDAAWKNTIPS